MAAAENTTREGIVVSPGQVWRDLDKRSAGRTVTVLEVADGVALVTTGATKSRIRVARMHRSSTGYELCTAS